MLVCGEEENLDATTDPCCAQRVGCLGVYGIGVGVVEVVAGKWDLERISSVDGSGAVAIVADGVGGQEIGRAHV